MASVGLSCSCNQMALIGRLFCILYSTAQSVTYPPVDLDLSLSLIWGNVHEAWKSYTGMQVYLWEG